MGEGRLRNAGQLPHPRRQLRARGPLGEKPPPPAISAHRQEATYRRRPRGSSAHPRNGKILPAVLPPRPPRAGARDAGRPRGGGRHAGPAPSPRRALRGGRAPGSARRSPVAGTRCTNFPPRAHHSGGASSRSPGRAAVPPHPSPRALALSPRRGSGRRAGGRAGRARPYLFQVALAQARRCCVPRSSAEAAAGSLLPRSLRLGELMNFNLRRVLMVTPAARAAPTRARRRALRHAPRCAPGPGRRRAAPSTRKLGSEQEAQRPRGVPPRPRASAPGPQPAGPPG